VITSADARLDALGHAVADATRRRILEHLRTRDGATTGELAGLAPTITRFAVIKHLAVLRRAGLLRTMTEGRRRRHYLEPAAIEPLRDWMAG
jgi:predicted transcriptional regulator